MSCAEHVKGLKSSVVADCVFTITLITFFMKFKNVRFDLLHCVIHH
jgi:hypothetical protein